MNEVSPITTLWNKKKIKIKLKEKKSRLNSQRACVKWIMNPILFLNPYKTFKIYLDIVITEENNCIIWDSSSQNQYMMINKAQIERENGLITFSLSEKYQDFFEIWKYLVARLESYGNLTIYGYAQSIKNFCQNYERITLLICENLKNRTLDENLQNWLMFTPSPQEKEDILKNNPAFIFRYAQNGLSIKKVGILYNKKFVEMLGYDLDTWVSLTLKHGILKYRCTNKVEFNDILGLYLNNYLNSSVINNLPERSTYLFTKNKYKIPVFEKPKIFASFSIQNGCLIDYIFAYRPDLSKKSIISDEKFKSYEDFGKVQILQRENEQAEFLKKFYDQKFAGTVHNIDKICKIKNIQQNTSFFEKESII